MIYNKYKLHFWIRLVLLQGVMLAFTYFLFDKGWYFTTLLFLAIFLFLAVDFIRFTSSTNKKITHFLKLAESDDYAFAFNQQKQGNGFDELHHSLNRLLRKLKEARIDKEAQLLFFNEMILKLETGILAIDEEGEVLIANPALRALLNVPEDKNWKRLSSKIPEVAVTLENLQNNERKIVRLNTNQKSQQILVTRRSLKISKNHYSFYSFQNIHKELEQKEIESWHKLIRVLTHEIMNSVSPIVSLSATLGLLLKKKTQEGHTYKINAQDFEDIELSLSTIQNRSKSLMSFIDEYTKLTRVPQPKKESFEIKTVVDELLLLISETIQQHNIQVHASFSKDGLRIKGDSTLLEQVFLNLLLNAIDACKGNEKPEINIQIDQNPTHYILLFEDNGEGIDEEIEPDIFLPFFTTKENGSGIGLSLSKNIIVAHGGELNYMRKTHGSCFKIELPA